MLTYVQIIIGLVLLVKGADYLVKGSASLGKKLNLSPLVIGLTVVAFGTSLPELIVNLIAVVENTGDVAIGTIIGSNISNILLVLGATALVMPVVLKESTVWKEIPFALLATTVLLVMASRPVLDGFGNSVLYKSDGIILLSFFAVFLYYIVQMAKTEEKHKSTVTNRSYTTITLMTIGGAIGLYFGGRWAVNGVIGLSQQWGVSEFLISAIAIALGTSLPELMTSLTAAFREEVDLAVGNIMGSNVFNILWVLGLTSVVRPVEISSFIITDLAILLGVTALLFFSLFVWSRHELSKKEGIVFLALYATYITFLVIRG